MSAASELTSKIISQLYLDGAYAWRAASVGVYDAKMGGYRTAAKKGVSDILACWKGQLIAIEVKIGKDRMSQEQVGFMKNIMQAGGLHCIARDLESFLVWWNEVKKLWITSSP